MSDLHLEPVRATLDELQSVERRKMVPVDGDVLGVVQRLKSIDPGLQMLYDATKEVFVLYWVGMRADEKGVISEHEDLVGAYKELDQRVINLIERIDAQGRGRTDLAEELERLQAAKDRENAYERLQKVGPIGERLRWAMRKDLDLEGDTVHMSGSKGAHRMRAEKRRKRGR